MDNVALAIEEQRVGKATIAAYDATVRHFRRVVADGQVTAEEIVQMLDYLRVLGVGLMTQLALDDQDLANGKTLNGDLGGLAKGRAALAGAAHGA